MASSSDNLAPKLEWYVIRDVLLGENAKTQDVRRALELASTCKHPDAQWLIGVCSGKDVKTSGQARAVFLAQGNDDARAVCFAALIAARLSTSPSNTRQMHIVMKRFAEMGFAFAQAWMSFYTGGLERFTFASRAAAQGERDGFYHLGLCFKSGVGCEQDLEKAKENLLIAAKMNCNRAMENYGLLLDESDPQRWYCGAVPQPEDQVTDSCFILQIKSFDSSLILLSLLSCL